LIHLGDCQTPVPQLGRVGSEGRHRPRGAWGGPRPEPVPYGTPFSAILRRFAQDPRKTWPTGHRPAEVAGGRCTPRNPRPATPQLGRVGPESRHRPRGAWGGPRPEPVPYGTPFSAILRRFAQDPRKTWPTGHRPAEVAGRARMTWCATKCHGACGRMQALTQGELRHNVSLTIKRLFNHRIIRRVKAESRPDRGRVEVGSGGAQAGVRPVMN